jgi:hypothetical protein
MTLPMPRDYEEYIEIAAHELVEKGRNQIAEETELTAANDLRGRLRSNRGRFFIPETREACESLLAFKRSVGASVSLSWRRPQYRRISSEAVEPIRSPVRRKWSLPLEWPLDLLPRMLAAIDNDSSSPRVFFQYFADCNAITRSAFGIHPLRDCQAHRYLTAAAAGYSWRVIGFQQQARRISPGAVLRQPPMDELTRGIGVYLTDLTLDVHFELDKEFRRLDIGKMCGFCGRLTLSAKKHCSQACESAAKQKRWRSAHPEHKRQVKT